MNTTQTPDLTTALGDFIENLLRGADERWGSDGPAALMALMTAEVERHATP